MTKIVIAEQTHKWVERCEELQKENAQLKELLKEIRQQIKTQVFGSPRLQLFEGTFDNKLLAKIDEALQ